MSLPPDPSPPLEAPNDAFGDVPCIIIHPNVLVSEDLRDILISRGATEVLTATQISQAPLSPARLVMIAGKLETILATPQGLYWKEHGIPVILIEHDKDNEAAAEAGLHVLPEPFRDEDVVKTLERLQVF